MKQWVALSFVAAAAVGILVALAILMSVHHLFDVLGHPSQDQTFQWAAVFGGLGAAVSLGSILLAIGLVRFGTKRITGNH